MAISADGRYAVFEAPSVFGSQECGAQEIFYGTLRSDLRTGTVTEVSVDTQGCNPDSDSGAASISADGRYVAFESFATDHVVGDCNGLHDVFVRDLEAEITTRVSVDTVGGDADGVSTTANVGGSISNDGRYVAFQSKATDLVSGDSNGFEDVFVRDLQTGTTQRVSVDTDGGDANAASSLGSITPDGRFVRFSSAATDLVSDGAGGTFLRDLQTGTTTRLTPAGQISGNLRYLLFGSTSDEVPDGLGGGLFVRDRQTGATARVNLRPRG